MGGFYALHGYALSVCLFVCLVPTVNSKTENHTMFANLQERLYQQRELGSNWQTVEQFWGTAAYSVGMSRTYSLHLAPHF